MPRRKFSRLTNEQKQTLRGDLDAKVPVTELAKKYGVSRRTIYNLKNRWDERLPQSRSKVLTVRVSTEDMERLDALAKELDLSRADTARRVLLYAAGIYHIEPPEAGEIAELTKEVSAIGQNVNQAVRAMNAAVLRGQKIPACNWTSWPTSCTKSPGTTTRPAASWSAARSSSGHTWIRLWSRCRCR